jgi:PKD repeat protein
MKKSIFLFGTVLLLFSIAAATPLAETKSAAPTSTAILIQPTFCMQDASNGSTFQLNTQTGEYAFTICSEGISLSGIGTVTIKGSVVTLQHNPSDRRVLARIDDSVKVGTASVQVFSLGRTFTLSDRNISATLCNTITWSQQQLDLQLAPGQSAVRDVTLSSSSNVNNAVIQASPEIANFVTIQPPSFVSLPAGQPQSVRLSFSIPQATSLQTYEGTIRVKTGGCNLQQTLKIVLNVGDNSTFRGLPEASPTSGVVPLTVTFITRAFYTGGGIIRYRWDFEGDGIFDTSDPGARNYTRTFTQKGIYNAVLEVMNDRNQITTASVTITVSGRPPTAAASVNPSNGASPLTVNFTGSGTDTDGTIVKYEWDFEGDGTFDFTSSTTGNTTHVYNSAGTFNAVFRVTDNDGLTATAQVTATAIRVGPPGSPTATITSPANPITVNAPFTVSFNGLGTDPDGKIIKYEWDFDGNGVYDFSSSTSAATSFRYESPGTFTAALRVTDNSGLTGIDTIDITVNIIVNLTLPNDTCRPLQGGTISVNSSQGGTTPITIFIRNATGQTVRTLVNNVLRTAGTYSDAWDCKDAKGEVVPEGSYFAILQYVANGQTRILDESTTTGGVLFNPDWTMSTSQGSACFNCLFKPLEDDFLKVDFNLNRAAEVSVSVRLFFRVDEIVPLFDRKLFGRGNFTIFWDGTDATGRIVTPPPGEQLLWGMTAFTLPNNAIFVEAAPQLSNVSVSPNYFDPATGNFISPQSSTAKVTYTLSKEGRVLLQVFRTGTNRLVRTITQANVPAGAGIIEWDGRNQNGIFVDKGDYHLALKAIDAASNQSVVRFLLVRVFY